MVSFYLRHLLPPVPDADPLRAPLAEDWDDYAGACDVVAQMIPVTARAAFQEEALRGRDRAQRARADGAARAGNVIEFTDEGDPSKDVRIEQTPASPVAPENSLGMGDRELGFQERRSTSTGV